MGDKTDSREDERGEQLKLYQRKGQLKLSSFAGSGTSGVREVEREAKAFKEIIIISATKCIHVKQVKEDAEGFLYVEEKIVILRWVCVIAR